MWTACLRSSPTSAAERRRLELHQRALMGTQQDALTALLREAGFAPAAHPRPNAPRIRALGLAEEVGLIYRALSGRSSEPRSQPGPWDIPCDRVIVELDEQRHFNRYRSVTLNAPTYGSCKVIDVPEYRTFCETYEPDCLRSARHRGYWTNASAEREFGPSAPEGVLEGAGSARWRQRAFYDYLKDAYATAAAVPLLRVAIWEQVEGRTDLTLGVALKMLARGRNSEVLSRTVDHVLARIYGRLQDD